MTDIQNLKEKLSGERNSERRMELYRQLSVRYWHISDLAKCRKYSYLSIKLGHRYEMPEYVGSALNMIALCHASQSDFNDALDYFLQALRVFETVGYPQAEATILNNIGLVHLQLDNLEKALEFFHKADEQNYDDNKVHSIRFYNEIINLNIGIVYTRMHQPERALEYLGKALDEARGKDNNYTIATCLVNLGEAHQSLCNLAQAQKLFEEALDLARQHDDKKTIVPILNNLGTILRHQERYDDSRSSFEKALEMAREIGNRNFEFIALSGLSRLYEAMGDATAALRYYKQYSTLKDSVYTADLSNKIAKLQAAYDNENKSLRAQQMVERATRLASIGAMAGGITHEINQPLNAIKISADSVLYWHKLNPGILPELFVQEVANIATAEQRIEKIIKHMRSFWVPASSSQTELIELNDVLKSALTLLDRQLCSHGIEQEYQLADTTLKVEGTRIQLEQVIINLTVNAMHALDDVESDDKRITFVTMQQDACALLRIIDNGPGLQRTDEGLYDPFYSTKKPGKGMGLGLAIVKQIIDNANGTIEATNTEQGGAQFTITLPLYKDECDENISS
jgi:C4-dicarboxylate-specific signal transduction histidine kinase